MKCKSKIYYSMLILVHPALLRLRLLLVGKTKTLKTVAEPACGIRHLVAVSAF